MDNITSAINASTAGAPLYTNISSRSPLNPQKKTVQDENKIGDSVETTDRESDGGAPLPDSRPQQVAPDETPENTPVTGQHLDLFG